MGIGTIGAGSLRFYTNSVLNATLDSSGNLGLGVTPSAWTSTWKVLQIGYGAFAQSSAGNDAPQILSNAYYTGSNYYYQINDTASRFQTNNPGFAWYIAPSGTAGNAISFTQAMTLDNSGNLLVGTTTANNNNSNSFAFNVANGNQFCNHINGTASGTGYIQFSYNGTVIGTITQNGTTGVLYNITSDQRLKTNIVDAPQGNIDQIKVRSFDWIADGSHQEYGMVAQELLEVAPYAVHQPQDPEEMMGVDYSKLVPMMIKEIQDLKAEVNQLKQKIGV